MTQGERRRQLRQQRRREGFRQLWRILVFLAVAGSVGYALLRQGWVLTGPAQVEVVGSQQVKPEQVVQAAGLRFPQPLLSLQPHAMARELSNALPVDQVQVHRLMAPPRLRVQGVDRLAVAQAQRRVPKGVELGFVDQLGNWMTAQQQSGAVLKLPEAAPGGTGGLALQVKGWQPRHRVALALLLGRRAQLGSALLAIRFEPGGSLWLDTTSLGAVRFGPVDARLVRRVEVLEHLLKTLPPQLKGRALQSIDLSDPEQPEISLPGPLRVQARPLASP